MIACLVLFVGYSEIRDEPAVQTSGFRALQALVRTLSYNLAPVYDIEPELPLIPAPEPIPVAVTEDSLLSLDSCDFGLLGETLSFWDPPMEQ